MEERVAPEKERVVPEKERVAPERVAPERVEKRKRGLEKERVKRSIISAKPILLRAGEWVAQLQVRGEEKSMTVIAFRYRKLQASNVSEINMHIALSKNCYCYLFGQYYGLFPETALLLI